MESNYNNENFERFLRESSDQYRMYASENVWKNIYSYLHTRRRWFGIGLILLLSAGFVTTIMLTNSSSVSGNHQVAQTKELPVVKKESAQNTTEAENLILTPYSNNKITTKEKSPLLQPFESTGNLNSISSPVVSSTVDAVVSEKYADNIFNNVLPVEKSEAGSGQPPLLTSTTDENTTILTPIAVNIIDQITDQDTWTNSIGGLMNNNTGVIKNDIYRTSALSANKPLTIESVINSYARRNKKLSFQYYFTPTISYRKLSENKSYIRQNSGALIYGDINNVVTHKPDLGLEVGVSARYALNKILKVRAGVQFNTSRYDIKAFSYATERTTIALNTGYSVDSIRPYSNYRNFNGYQSDWLHNFYFQISMPVGIEVKLAGDDKVQFGIASTLQPTYILGDRVYLLSSNYKNYAEVPSLIRRWNMNTSLEAFVSYSTGKMNWQIGPQVRYQLYSSYVKEYPVKENLFDFGLKIGVSPNR